MGSGVVRIDPLCFLAGCHKRQLNQALSFFCLRSLSVLLFIRAPFYVALVCICMCSVFWLLWLSCQYLLSDWLERLVRGSLTVARGLSPQSPGRKMFMTFGLMYYFIVCLSCFSALHNIFRTPVAWYSLFVLKMLLNTNQPTNLTLTLDLLNPKSVGCGTLSTTTTVPTQ